MQRSFYIKPGIIISLSIGCFFVLRFLIPLKSRVNDQRLVRWADGGWSEFLMSFFVISLFSFTCWVIHQYGRQTQFRLKALNYEWVKGVMGVLLCILLSYGIDQLKLALNSGIIH